MVQLEEKIDEARAYATKKKPLTAGRSLEFIHFSHFFRTRPLPRKKRTIARIIFMRGCVL